MNINDNNNNKNLFSNFEYKLKKFKLKNIKKFNNNFDLVNTTLIQDLSTKNKTDIKNSNIIENNLSSNKNNFFDSNVSNSLIDNNNIINIKKKFNNNNNENNNIKNDNIKINKKIEKKEIIKSKSSIFEKKIKEIKFNILQKKNSNENSKKNIFNLKKVPLLINNQKIFQNTTNLKNNFQKTEFFKRDYLFYKNLSNLNNFIQTNNNLFEKTNLNKSLTPRKKNQIPEIFQCFNSSSAKNLFYENKKNFNKIGPGYYNITKYKSILPQKEKKIYFNNKKKNNNNNNNILPGPGYYNISKNFIKKSFSNENIFSHEIRFKNNIQISPGPGEYNININNNNNNKNKYKPFFRKINNNKENIIKRNLFNNNNFINYSFSTIDNSHTIQFNILKKLFNKNYKNAPFGSGDFKKHSYINKTNNNLGGFYQNDLFKTIVQKNNNYFFKNTEINNNNNNKLRYDVPISYYKESYFNWNKKSFNINYNEI